MSYNVKVKARCVAMLLTGDAPLYVEEVTGVSRRTLGRWRAEFVTTYRPYAGVDVSGATRRRAPARPATEAEPWDSRYEARTASGQL